MAVLKGQALDRKVPTTTFLRQNPLFTMTTRTLGLLLTMHLARRIYGR